MSRSHRRALVCRIGAAILVGGCSGDESPTGATSAGGSAGAGGSHGTGTMAGSSGDRATIDCRLGPKFANLNPGATNVN